MVKRPKGPRFITPADETEAYALVGRFFHLWAALEYQINDIIRKALKLEHIPALVMLLNVQFQGKVHILHTALTLQPLNKSADRKKRIKKAMERLGDLNKKRNLIAHTMFDVYTRGVIQFYRFEARGEIRVPEVFWSKEEFSNLFSDIHTIRKEIADLTVNLKYDAALMAEVLMRPMPSTDLQ